MDIDKEFFIVAIQHEDDANANKGHFSETTFLNDEEIVVEIPNDLNENLTIEKEIDDDIREQVDPNLVVKEISRNNSLRYPYDGLNLEKNNNHWDDEH